MTHTFPSSSRVPADTPVISAKAGIAVPLPAERSSDRIPKKPFGVLGQHSKTWSDAKSACLPLTPRPAAE